MNSTTTTTTLGVIGAGNMAEALTGGIIKGGILPPDAITACDPSPERREKFGRLGVKTADNNQDACNCDVILLSIKPQIMEEVLSSISRNLGPDKLLISIAAGIPTEMIASKCPQGTRIIRVMPNTPMLAGKGASGVSKGPCATDADEELVLSFCRSAGIAVAIPEDKMDAVTALSGSGPAYFFLFCEIMTRAGIELGLPAELSEQLARQTFVGAGSLLEQQNEAASVLRERVTSPGGTTEAAINFMKKNNISDIIAGGMRSAEERARELAAISG